MHHLSLFAPEHMPIAGWASPWPTAGPKP
jgi:hypothetical protein